MALPSTSSDTLIVPLQLDALVVNKPIYNGGETWNRWQINYDELNSFNNPVPAPFASQNPDPPDIGIHVHWALPDGLTHGVETTQGSGDFTYPYLPNRWLVVRVLKPSEASTKPPELAAWVITSDTLGAANGSGYLDPTYDAGSGDPVKPIKLGNSVTLAEWQASGGESGVDTPPPFLRAVAPGNLTFAGFVPGNNNVLSFHDPMTSINAGFVSYQLLGWYTDPQADPLHGRTSKCGWAPSKSPSGDDIMVANNLEWAVDLTKEDTMPTITAVAGLIHGVTWDLNTPIVDPVNYPANISEDVRIAVGATSADALAALIRDKAIAGGASVEEASLEADLLEAFQLDLLSDLDSPGGQEQLSRQLHDEAFGKAFGGYRWDIAPVRQADTANPTQPPPLTPEQRQWVATLNKNQADFDLQSRILQTMQQELADLWWKNGRIKHVPTPGSETENFENAKKNLPGQLDPSNPDGMYAKVVAQKAVVQEAKAKIPIAAGPNSKESITKFSATMLDPKIYELKPSGKTRFSAPADPVILISGLGRSERFGHDDVLSCRLPDQLVHGITFNGTDINAASMTAGSIPQIDAAHLPDLANPLLSEAFWLSPGDAANIANAGLKSTDHATISTIQEHLAAIPPADVLGTPPAAIGNRLWSQPWLPLYLEWSVDFSFTFQPNGNNGFKTNEAGDYLFDRPHWVFNGSDYQWTGGALDPQSKSTYTGQTFLTPNGSFTFLKRLQEYLAKNPNKDLQNVEDALEELSKLDILSQSLSGLTSSLAMIDPNPNLAPPSTMDAVIENGADKGVPIGTVDDQDRRFGQGKPFFFPVRAGFLDFVKLRLTDGFGRTLSLLKANGNAGGHAETFKPIAGRGLAPDPHQLGPSVASRTLELTPRLAQNSRLDFTWISSSDDTKLVDFTPDASPVCGWLLPNHLDKSLSVYDAAGIYLGEVLVVFIAKDQNKITWIPAPGNMEVSPVVDPDATPAIANQHLKAIIMNLLDHADGPIALANFLNSIDETLWTVNPASSKTDRDLASLIGRPLAVTRVNIALGQYGTAQVNQAFYKTFKPETAELLQDPGSLEEFTWPLRFGSQALRHDGTIGYFAENNYSVFNAVHVPGTNVASGNPYVKRIEAGNFIDLPIRPEAPGEGPEAFLEAGSKYLTLLLDPNGSVNISTGLLPSLEVTLDDRFVNPAREAMAVTFRTGPLLLDSDAICLPVPSVSGGEWSWLQPTGTAVGDWQTDKIGSVNSAPQLNQQPPILREGWLKFKPDKI